MSMSCGRIPLGMFTTLLIGIDPESGFCISADPIIHSPTKFFTRLEFKDEHAEEILDRGWFAWERVKRNTPMDAPRIETLVGARREKFLDLVRFERAARGLEPGNRLILAESHALSLPTGPVSNNVHGEDIEIASMHPLVKQFNLSPEEILDLIAGAKRLKMAVKGWVAEEYLRSTLSQVPGITHYERLDEEGKPDIKIAFKGGPHLTIECKNVSRATDKFGNPKVDFQLTRAAKGNRVLAIILLQTSTYCRSLPPCGDQFLGLPLCAPGTLPPHKSCVGRITSNIRVDRG
jgi:hypothetical protein